VVNDDSAPPPRLRGWLSMAFGVLAIVLGALWTLQGLDIITGSEMSGIRLWARIGPAVAAAGLLLTVVGVWLRARGKRQGP